MFNYFIAGWCNGSTRDSGSRNLGSNPSPAAIEEKSSFTLRRFPAQQAIQEIKTAKEPGNVVLNYIFKRKSLYIFVQ